MKTGKSPKEFIKRYIFSENFSLEARMINMICLLGMGAALIATFTRVAMKAEPALIIVMGCIVVSIAMFMFMCNRMRFYRPGVWIVLIMLGDILFPTALFFLGGADSGMAAYFVVSISAIFFISHGIARVTLLITNIIWVTACYYIAYLYPGTVAELGRMDQTLDNIQSFIVSGLFVGLLLLFQSNIYKSEKRKAMVAGDALIRQDRLLHTVNEAASILLTTEQGEFTHALSRGMEMMARDLSVDRVYIWKNITIDNILYYIQIFEWTDENGKDWDKTVKAMEKFPYIKSIPEWEAKLERGECIRGRLSSLSENEQARLAPYGVKSILVAPVFLQEGFWGFVSFDDCHTERDFSDDEVSILRSGSLLLANAITRNESERILENRLKQQEVMSTISQGFISYGGIDLRINSALREIGEFIGTTCVRIITAEAGAEDGSEAEDGFDELSWRVTDDVRDASERLGIDRIANSSSPEEMPGGGAELIIHYGEGRTEPQYAAFEAAGLKAFIWGPLYVEGRYWGMLSVEDWGTSRRWTESNLQLVNMASSAIAGAISRELMERERAAALAQAVQASKAKGDFLSNMSHEMRTPMNAIIGMTSIARSSSEMERKDYCLNKIEDASTHLLGVINDILDMSKIEANKLELSEVEFGFERMLQKVVNVVNFRVDEKNQDLIVHIDNSIPRYLVGDDQRLAQVITNLLSNAVKFTPENGSIKLKAESVKKEGNVCTIKIEVSDTGIGISEDQLPRLFTSFEQAENTTSRKFGGTGLGLAISKRIVGLMGGEIGVKSKRGKGTTFAFAISLKEGSEKPQRSQLYSTASWKNLRILAVDDAEATREYIADITRQFGALCDVAAGGEEALEIIKENGKYDIYFVDCKMPHMDGIELATHIKELHGIDPPTIVMISFTDWSYIEDEAKEAGVTKFLGKPIFPSDISDCINECMGNGNIVEAESADGEPDCFKGYHMLLAEDIDINREIVLALLEPTEVEIDCAENGAEALQMFSDNPERYDMIFMDVQMPEMDGYEATRRIRALGTPAAALIPIVAMTANVFREDIEKCLAVGMNGHVGKPLDFEEVLNVLRQYFSGKNVPEPGVFVQPGQLEPGLEEGGGAEAAPGGMAWAYGFAWSHELETGNAEIDAQHKELFRLTSDLVDACVNDHSPEVLGKALEFLASYTVRHFEDEERLQLEYGFPDYERHKKIHDDFKTTVGELIAEYKEVGSTDDLIHKVHSVIIHWLVQHIKGEDSKIAIHIRKVKQQGQSADTSDAVGM
ncbi:MAG: bacteriohemerythrin [Clostridiales Family XIII bacterium]|jgi:hemerythrin-like metal-binding protein|nr:bacteriohemerythrin [Clostridiales Family XIII bacterium]